jgi:hypothetical protein
LPSRSAASLSLWPANSTRGAPGGWTSVAPYARQARSNGSRHFRGAISWSIAGFGPQEFFQ